jgi:serine/threonine protein phosphatase PrpC
VSPLQALLCPSCGSPTLADDEYCEVCGACVDLAAPGSDGHTEVDLGDAAAVSDTGLRHARNDDACFVAVDARRSVGVVCDGVSSASGARVAAEVGAAVIGVAIAGGRDPAEAVRSGCDAVAALPWSETPDRTSPASTVVAATWDGQSVIVSWLGDSRAYWVADGEARQLSDDHSWAREQIVAGLADPDDPVLAGRDHVITRWLGVGGLGAGPGRVVVDPDRPGLVVLCTDGLWHHVPDAVEIAAVATAAQMCPIDVARRLTSIAVERGGVDNVTVAVLTVHPGHGRTRPEGGAA